MKNLVYADLDSIVFEGRNRDYGAYQIRKRYNRYLTRALLLVFLVFVTLTAFPKVLAWLMPPGDTENMNGDVVTVVDISNLPPLPPKDEDIPEVAPPPPPAEPTVATVAYLNPNPTPDELVSDSATIADITALDSAVIALVDQDGDDPGDYNYNFELIGTGDEIGDVVVAEEAPAEIPSDSFMVLDAEPQAVNMSELKDLIGYPAMAREAEIQGKVILRVYLDKYGNYLKHIVLKDPHPILTNAVAKHIDKLKMTPGVQAGRPIKVWVTIPFNFTLHQ